ncbi:MAG: hypothetical protein HZA89_06410 [Verrucomicrobia bacterium]|nr:hypothetical protein [Verrucomicrobiota bacterium]
MMRALDLWLPAYLRRARRPAMGGVTDILLCVCDHFEPLHDTDKAGALARLAEWKRELPKFTKEFRDADGCPPRHTFFYPIEQYDPDILNDIADICRVSGGEVEIHLHHDRDTAEGLRQKLEQGKTDFARHDLLARDAQGRTRYGFVHGNWALDDSHPEGRGCGVRNELAVLRDTGCYADFTMPSAPSRTQTQIINRLYYAKSTPAPKSHNTGVSARVGAGGGSPPGDLLLVQGPLGLNWERRKWGVLPRIENADLTGANPPRLDRMRLWLRLGIHVVDRPEWVFIKLHTHGGIPRNFQMLLGEPMREFHRAALGQFNDGKKFRLHYVSARELVNILHAAEDGRSGNAGEFRDYRYRLAGRA